MPKLQDTGPISVTNINSLKGYGSNQTSLQGRDKEYMGNSNPAAPQTSNVCMPNEELNQNATPTKAREAEGWTWSNTTGDPGYNSQTWGPHKMSEFYEAYSGVPTCSVSTAGIGDGSWPNATFTGRCKIDIFVNAVPGLVTEGGTGPWYYWVNSTPGAYSTNQWVQINSLGNHTVSNDANTGNPATITVYLKDALNCGANKEIVYTGTYP